MIEQCERVYHRDQSSAEIQRMGKELQREVNVRKFGKTTLRQSNWKFKNLIANIPCVIYQRAFDTQWTIYFISDEIENLTGYPASDFLKDVSLSYSDIICEDDRERVKEAVRKGIEKREPFFVEYRIIHKNGTVRWVTEKGQGVFDSDGNVLWIDGAISDQTELKVTEERNKAHLEEKKVLLKEMHQTMEGIISVIATTVEKRDPYTAGHQRRVAELAYAIAVEIDLSDKQKDGIRMAGNIHDIGKISIPAEILSKPGEISEIELNIIKEHSKAGYDIVRNIDFPWPIAEMIYQHHEYLDGTGYPRGLRGDEILLETRILTVADVVDAMSSHRPYRAALGIDFALDEINRNRGILYDPDAVDACDTVIRRYNYQLNWEGTGWI